MIKSAIFFVVFFTTILLFSGIMAAMPAEALKSSGTPAPQYGSDTNICGDKLCTEKMTAEEKIAEYYSRADESDSSTNDLLVSLLAEMELMNQRMIEIMQQIQLLQGGGESETTVFQQAAPFSLKPLDKKLSVKDLPKGSMDKLKALQKPSMKEPKAPMDSKATGSPTKSPFKNPDSDNNKDRSERPDENRDTKAGDNRDSEKSERQNEQTRSELVGRQDERESRNAQNNNEIWEAIRNVERQLNNLESSILSTDSSSNDQNDNQMIQDLQNQIDELNSNTSPSTNVDQSDAISDMWSAIGDLESQMTNLDTGSTNSGTPGPAGPSGPQGPAGPSGLPGPAAATPTSLLESNECTSVSGSRLYLQLHGEFRGGSTDAEHDDWIEVNGFCYFRAVPSNSNYVGASRDYRTAPPSNTFEVVKPVDSSSTEIFSALLSGERLLDLTLDICDQQSCNVQITMTDVYITSHEPITLSNGESMEKIGFTGSTFAIGFTPTKSTPSTYPDTIASGTTGTFLTIEGIRGADQQKIPVSNFGFNVFSPAPPTGLDQYRRASSPSFGDFVLIKPLDHTTPQIFSAFSNGDTIDSVTIETCDRGGCEINYELEDARITSLKPVYDNGLGERVTFSFNTITLHHDNNEAGYDLAENEARY